MPIAIGRFEYIVPEKSGPLSKTISAISAISVNATRAALTSLSAHALAAGVLAHTAAPAWNDLGVKWDTNDTWGAGYGKSPTRMAADDRGSLFVSNGDSLSIGSPSGTEWKTEAIFQESLDWRHTPVIRGQGGSMLWGSWISINRESGWKRVSGEYERRYYSMIAIAPDGWCLFGGSYDLIERSLNPGDKPERMHFGRTYGSIIDIAIVSSGKAYAAPDYADLLVSRDAGRTWQERRTLLKSDPSAPQEAGPATGLLALEPAYPEAYLWMARVRWREKPHVAEYVWSGDSLAVRRHANYNAPDSAIKAFRLQRPANGPIILWLGTWGQGVFRSTDRGESWQAVNSGLKDLYIEALVEGAEGRIFALTRAGLFSLSGNALGLNPSRMLRTPGRAVGSPGAPFLFGAPDGRRFRLDGRIGMEPAPEQSIRIDRR